MKLRISLIRSALSGVHAQFRNMATARALVFEQHGSPENVLELKEIPITDESELADHEIVVEMLAAPLNPSDVNTVEGRYPLLPPLPGVGGHEGVGLVSATGPKVSKMSVGDHVIALASKQGTWRTTGVFDESAWYRVPRELPISVAGTMSINPPTALCMLRDYVDLSPGDVVIQDGANSAVGRYAIQIARHRGLQTVNVVRERDPAEQAKLVADLEALGATLVTTPHELKAALARSGLPAPKLALDCVGGDVAAAIAKTLEKGGTMVTYGAMSKKGLTIPPSLLIFKDISFKGFWLSGTYANRPREKEAVIDEVADLFLTGVLTPSPVEAVELAEWRKGLKDYAAANNRKTLFSFDGF